MGHGVFAPPWLPPAAAMAIVGPGNPHIPFLVEACSLASVGAFSEFSCVRHLGGSTEEHGAEPHRAKRAWASVCKCPVKTRAL